MRYAIYIRKNGREENMFKNDRSFATKKWAWNLVHRYSRLLENAELFIKEVPDLITDTQRLEWVLEDEMLVTESNGGFYFNGRFGKTLREAIDAAMNEHCY